MAAHSPNSSLTDLVGEGWIGPVHCAGREILRRIFVTVRDRNWQEVRPTKFTSTIDGSTRTVHLNARHTSELVDFEWEGELAVSEDGRELSFAFKGQALRDMDICRLGLIVLHPVDSMIGSRVTASSHQIDQTFTIDEQLAPQPIIGGVPGAMTEPFTDLLIEREDWGQLALSFEGDLFELEDQRNWGDASFKTYCTPLRKGFPRTVKKGTGIAHSVKLRFSPATSMPRVSIIGPAPDIQQNSGHVPDVGRVWRNHPDAADDESLWDFIHIDLTGESVHAAASLLQESQARRFEIGISVHSLRRLSDWLCILREHRDRIARLLLYGRGTGLPDTDAVQAWFEALEISFATRPPLFVATRGYFVEFNRSVPFTTPFEGIAFPLTGSVHSADAETLMSNVATVRDMAETGRRVARVSEIALVPLALYHPPSTSPPKLSSEIGQAWLTATLRNAVGAGVASITLADDVAAHFSPTLLQDSRGTGLAR